MPDLTDDERNELYLLRAEKADRMNPNVILIEGKIEGGDEFFATAVKTSAGEVYLAKLIDDLYADSITFAYHLSSEPKSFHELEEHMVQVAMGASETEFRHRYSDLTGYLWTDEKLSVGGHDVLKEIADFGRPCWIALRVEKQP